MGQRHRGRNLLLEVEAFVAWQRLLELCMRGMYAEDLQAGISYSQLDSMFSCLQRLYHGSSPIEGTVPALNASEADSSAPGFSLATPHEIPLNKSRPPIMIQSCRAQLEVGTGQVLRGMKVVTGLGNPRGRTLSGPKETFNVFSLSHISAWQHAHMLQHLYETNTKKVAR